MARLAVDVALLLPQEARRICEEMNARLRRNNPGRIDFRKALPHVSLWMGVVDQGDLSPLGRTLEGVARAFAPAALEAGTTRFNGKTSAWACKESRPLLRLQDALLVRLQPYLRGDPQPDHFADWEGGIDDDALAWVRTYRAAQTGAGFDPHVTLGWGEVKETRPPFRFLASTLALCRLGNHCTCREVLWQAELQG
ncbi:MAG: hypothetical protein HY520_02190 [Candidatus Aenigmarchaeota archaeon]|nr:hypothetical protein [Candidatus Aenigmarchaeota archaeon]